MDDSQVNSLIDGQITYDSEEGGLKRYLLHTNVELRDEENRTQVLSVGIPVSLPSKCVLLLGETGAGKTTIINAIINYLYGINFDDDFRLIVKEQMARDNRTETESQTDFITVYVLYHKEGMRHDCNFVLIDTPGLADTRGTLQQESVRNHLEAFLTTDYRIDDLHCIGLVAKACTNRDYSFQKDILGEIMLLLGNNVPDITNLFATFAVEKPVVNQIVKNAGVQFKQMFDFDNGVLFTPHKPSETVRQRDRNVLEYRWEIMVGQYNTFFSALLNAPSISVQVLREKKLLERSLKQLKVQVEELARLQTALEMNKKKLIKYELQEASNKEWCQERHTEKKNRMRIPEGYHAHNCLQCNQTCIFPCPPEKDSKNAGMIGGMAGAAAGAAATQATTTTVAATTSSGMAASVGAYVTQALGGSVAAAEVGAVGGVPGIIVGGMVGITIGVVTGAVCDKILAQKSCNLRGRGDVCGERRCLHSLSQHIKESERIIELTNIEVVINDDIKELYDVAVSKKTDAMAKILSERQKIQVKQQHAAQGVLRMLFHSKKIQEITQESVNPHDLIDQVIAEVRQGQPDHIHHAIEVLHIFKKANTKLRNCSADEVCNHCDMVMKLLENIPREN